STLIRRTESISCASATRDLPTRCTRPSSVSATGYDARCELPRLRSRLFLECTENGADPLAVDIFRRRGVALRLKPRIAVHVVGGNHFSGTVVEPALLAAAFFVRLHDDRTDAACPFAPFGPGQRGYL